MTYDKSSRPVTFKKAKQAAGDTHRKFGKRQAGERLQIRDNRDIKDRENVCSLCFRNCPSGYYLLILRNTDKNMAQQQNAMQEKKRQPVVFMMPEPSPHRSYGGYKVVYQYASLMAAAGRDVTILFSIGQGWQHNNWRGRACPFIRYPYYCLTQKYRVCTWFPIDPRVKIRMVWSFATHRFRHDALYVATAIQTAYALKCANLPAQHCFYLVQDYETWWFFTPEEVRASYGFGFRMAAVSRWLQELIASTGNTADFIPNGYDANDFGLYLRPEERHEKSVLMLYHESENKGARYGLEALERLQRDKPGLRAVLFGAAPRPAGLPDWIIYEQSPTRERLRRLYNEAAIFMGNSLQEGWGLPVGEAMMCGCAVACTDNCGYREMAQDGVTALISQPKDAEGMAANVCRLIDDRDLRLRLAHAGHRYIQAFTLQRSFEKWMSFLDNNH